MDLLKSKTPEEFIDNSLHLAYKWGDKHVLAKQWLAKTGFTSADLKHARHRHPYWKSKKVQGYQERNAKRWEQHNYQDPDRTRWTIDDFEQFLLLDGYHKSNQRYGYTYKDKDLARILKTTIPSIQYLRRKRNLAGDLSNRKKDILKLMCKAESYLRSLIHKRKHENK